MILDFVFRSLLGFLAGLLNQIPNTGALSWDLSGPAYLVGVYRSFDAVLPVSIVLGVFAFGIVFRSTFMAARISLWLYEHVPFVG